MRMYGIRTWRREALAKLCADPISICDETNMFVDAKLQRMNEAVAPISVRRSFEEIPVINVNSDLARHFRACHCTVASDLMEGGRGRA